MGDFTRRPRSAREKELLARGKRLLPSAVLSSSFSPEHAMVVSSAAGARLRDASGNEYIDYLMGSGPLLLGHAHPAVVEAVRQQAEKGSSFLVVNEKAIELAEAIVECVPCADKVCFNSSGSESTFFALRIARAFTGRDKFMKFEGAFHGMHDYALMSNQWTSGPADFPIAEPNSAGIPRAIEDQVLVGPWNDLETAQRLIEAHAGELAAIIVEPMQRSFPPQPGFLEGLREISQRHGIVLIFDEVVTGFRLALGGAQEYYGVVPDLAAVCKGIASGYPISVLCGRADLMELAGPARLAQGDHVRMTGTFSGNSIACAAALATLGELRKEGTYSSLFAQGRKLMAGLQGELERAGIPHQLTGEPPAFQPWFNVEVATNFRQALKADPALAARFGALLVDHGVLKAHEKFFVSTAHGDSEIEQTLEVFAAVADLLAKTG
ncbi:MAG: aspartate aminotransferase family protein [Myxococcota bacterium]|jgi:glutamate-1-semialdehyde 2,1-aminomutase|nr:aspartate aminotransferase family protein [Myxococcota bacterium]